MFRTIAGFLALHRYFIWANRMRTHFDNILSGAVPVKNFEIESWLYMSYWYAGLYVVIEGWRELQLNDAVIDSLLRSPNVELLRRYRNGVFHFQKAYMDDRFMAFITEGVNEVAWVRELNEQLGRFFLEQT
jgi:hypothetical protein